MQPSLAFALLLAGCRVDLGAPPPPDAGPCRPSPDYFVGNVQILYLDANQCASGRCHGFADGEGYFRLRPFGPAPAPGSPVASWPEAWRDNYFASVALVGCDEPLKSRLLTVPEGAADPHPPGDSVQDHPTAEAIFQSWVGAR